MNADGSNVTRLTDHPANDHDPIWMPDGQSLIFSSERDSRERSVPRVAGRQPRRSADASLRRTRDHADRIAGRQIRGITRPRRCSGCNSGSFQVHVLDLATGKTRALDNSGGACWPSWSPDRQSIRQRARSRRSRRRIQIRNADGSGTREIALGAKTWHYYPDWSKDGSVARASRSARRITKARTGTSPSPRRRLEPLPS